MAATLALVSLLVALLMAPLVLATHVVVRGSTAWTRRAWLAMLIGLMALSLTMAAISLVLLTR